MTSQGGGERGSRGDILVHCVGFCCAAGNDGGGGCNGGSRLLFVILVVVVVVVHSPSPMILLETSCSFSSLSLVSPETTCTRATRGLLVALTQNLVV